MEIRTVVLFCLMTLLTLVVGAESGSGIKTVSVVFSLAKPPYVSVDLKSGLELEIVKAAFEQEGYQVTPSFTSMKRGEILFRSGSVDGIIDKRLDSALGFGSDIYIEYHNVAATLRSRNIEIKNLEDLQSRSVTGFQTARELLGPKFRKAIANNRRYSEVASQVVQVEQLIRGRVEVIVGDELIFRHFQKKLQAEQGLKGEIEFHPVFQVNCYMMVFHSAEVRDVFNRGLKKIRQNKSYDQIMARYK